MAAESIAGFDCSPQQQRRFALAQARGGVWAHVVFRPANRYSANDLRAALGAVAARHEALRTRLRRPPSLRAPVQVIEAEAGVEVATAQPGDPGPRLAAHWATPPCGDAPVVRAELIDLDDGTQEVVLSAPATVVDDAALCLLATELEGLVSPEPALQYADASTWLLEAVADTTGSAAASWDLAPRVPPAHSTLRALRATVAERFVPRLVSIGLAAETTERAAEIGCETADLVLAAWRSLLDELSALPAVAGLACSGRVDADLAGIVGPLATTVPLACACDGESLAVAARSAAKLRSEAERHALAFAWHRQPVRAGERESWLPATFRVRREREGGPEIVDALDAGERFVVSVECSERGGIPAAALRYDAAALSDDRAAELAERLAEALERGMSAPSAPIRARPRAQRGTCLHELVLASAERTPDATAVVAPDGELTYAELDSRSAAVAAAILRRGSGGGVLGILLNRSCDLVAATLGALRAGAAYLPLDPALPDDRIRYLVADSGADAVVTSEALAGRVEREVETLVPDGDDLPSPAAEVPVLPSDLAYVLYTSGSTGRPRPVGVEHRQIVAYVRGAVEALRLEAGSSFASISTLAADLGNTAVFPALALGGCLHLVAAEVAVSPALLGDYFTRHGVDVVKATPSHLAALLEGPDPAAVLPRERLVLGGEGLPKGLARRLLALAGPDCMIFNHYGPTETTVGALAWQLGAADAEARSIPLGRPLPGVSARVVDGEICIGGAGVSRGYLDRPAETAACFVPDAAGHPGDRLYRTGDRGRVRADGAIEFLGRADDQVKVRGFRVELGEVAATLERQPGVSRAVVLLRDDRSEPELVAYVVPGSGGVDEPELRGALRGDLPEYMVPPSIVAIDALPLTGNGKLDRHRLPHPGAGARATPSAPPRDVTEFLIAEVWRELLGVGEVGVGDNFFDLGGHSLLAIRAIGEIGRRFGRAPRIDEFFGSPTVEGLAMRLRGIEASAPSPLIALGKGGRRSLFCLHSQSGSPLAYSALSRVLAPELSVYGFQDRPGQPTGLEELAAAYRDAIRDEQEVGPYGLVGWCRGTSLAFEVARLLAGEGEAILPLVLIDGVSPSLPPPAATDTPPVRYARHMDWPVVDRVRAAAENEQIEALLGAAHEHLLLPPGMGRDDLAAQVARYLDLRRMFDEYRPRPYDGSALLVLATDPPPTIGGDLGWSELVRGGVEVRTVEGTHSSIMRPPAVDELAAVVRDAVR